MYQLRDERDRFPPGSYVWHTVDVAVERIITGQAICKLGQIVNKREKFLIKKQ